MNWLSGFFGSKPQLTPAQASRLAAWRALPEALASAELEAARFVVVDVETSGLNLSRDWLIAIGAVAVRGGRIEVGDSFEVVLQQETASNKDNILIHGIGGSAQTGGMPPQEALLAFLEFLGKDPLVAFHVTFDETMIKRAMKQFLGLDFRHPWLDLAYVMPGLNPPLARKYRALDHWLGHFHIHNYARHNAMADALCTAQLLLIAMEQARRQRISHFRGMMDLEKAQRWVSWEG
ncbi:MAG: DNA polymerase III subunit epsilon [Nitrosomonadales bacterium]|nr:MAG: DNA polymerase III subunit epsilon [Nitrosomonadales bacterium]